MELSCTLGGRNDEIVPRPMRLKQGTMGRGHRRRTAKQAAEQHAKKMGPALVRVYQINPTIAAQPRDCQQVLRRKATKLGLDDFDRFLLQLLSNPGVWSAGQRYLMATLQQAARKFQAVDDRAVDAPAR